MVIGLFLLAACTDDTPDDDEIDTTLTTTLTDSLELETEYEGMSFLSDGIGEVDLVRCVDGDTAVFKDGSTEFNVRYLGIDTPESTYRFDPWGKAASVHMCEALENASTIVLEADEYTERKDNNDRYLAYVWLDGRNINLEMIELAYTPASGATDLMYGALFSQAWFKAQATERRIWGEVDPDFDYSKEGVQITIEELVTNQSEYIGKKVTVTGIISSKVGRHGYIQQGNYGVYVYTGFEYTTKFQIGNEIILDNVVPTYHPDEETGALQLSGFRARNLEILSEDNVVEPKLVSIDQLTDDMIGSLVEVNQLTIECHQLFLVKHLVNQYFVQR
jgi:micrococcal nuclease